MTALAPSGGQRPFIMRKGVSTLSDLADGAGALMSLMAAGGKWYYCDPTNGTTGGDGLSPATANSSLETVYALTRSGYNDGVIFLGGATACNPAAAITWSNNYCHLIGVSSGLPGLGQRCRVVALAATAVTPVITFSGSGCVVSNIQFYNEKAAGSAAGCVAISGLRNEFTNVFFMSPVATDAASYSCKLSAAENVFYRCTFGQFTNARSAASYSLWITGAGNVSRNKFIDCELLSWGAGATHVHVYHDSTLDAVPTVTWFESCMFHNVGTQLTQSIDDNSTAAGHQIVLRGNNSFLNVAAIADTLTYVFANDLNGDHVTSSMIMINPTET